MGKSARYVQARNALGMWQGLPPPKRAPFHQTARPFSTQASGCQASNCEILQYLACHISVLASLLAVLRLLAYYACRDADEQDQASRALDSDRPGQRQRRPNTTEPHAQSQRRNHSVGSPAITMSTLPVQGACCVGGRKLGGSVLPSLLHAAKRVGQRRPE